MNGNLCGVDESTSFRPSPAPAWLNKIRFVALGPIVGLFATMLATLGLSIAKTIKLVTDMLDGDWKSEIVVVSVLGVVDAYLLVIVQVIVIIGLYELFVGDLDVPAWLETRSLDQLKKPILDVLVVFVSIKGIEQLVVLDDPTDQLWSVGAVALLILAITAFRAFSARK